MVAYATRYTVYLRGRRSIFVSLTSPIVRVPYMKYALYERPVLGGAHTSGPSLRVCAFLYSIEFVLLGFTKFKAFRLPFFV